MNQNNPDPALSTVPDEVSSGPSTTEAYDQFLALLKKRRSCRSFRADPIPEGYLEKILEAARWAMSGANAQPWEFVVVQSRERIQALYKAYQDHIHEVNFWLEQRLLYELRHPAFQLEGDTEAQYRQLLSRPGWSLAPAVIAVLGDGRRQLASVSIVTTPGRHQTHLTDALSNAGMMIHLAAASLGLVTEWVSIQVPEPFKQLLNVPPLLTLHTIIPIGYPQLPPSGSYRRQLREIVHYETYDPSKMMTSEDVLKYLHRLRATSRRTYARSRGEQSAPRGPGE